MALQIVQQDDYFLATFSGALTPDDLVACAERTIELEDASDVPLDRIADLTPVESFDVNFLAVSDLAKKKRERHYSRIVKSALVADRPVAVGFARMYQTILNNPDVDVRIFPSLDEARAWVAEKGSGATSPDLDRGSAEA